MKKKALAIFMAGVLTLGLAACGSSSSTGSTAESAAPAESTAAGSDAAESTAAESSAADAAAEDVDYGSGNITIWVAEEVTSFTQTQAEQFLQDNPAYSGYTVTVEAVGEGDAASNMITDVEGGADIYGFAQDQLARLVSAGAVMEVIGDYADFVSTSNDSGAVSAATMGDSIYAFPVTSDNGYFLYYDSSVVTDPTSLEAIVADCEEAGKGFYMEINSGWYQTAFFFATGCELTYEADSAGNFTSSNVTYASEEGLTALKALINLASSSAFYNGSSVSNATNAAAIVDGTWDSGAAKELFGDNYACAKLPTFEADGPEYQMSGFGGFKLLGVKPQTDTNKAIVCMELAKYLSSAEVQLARYQEVGWGPSNLEAQADEAVQADEALTALAEQLTYTIPQGQYPNEYWDLATSLGDDSSVVTDPTSLEAIVADCEEAGKGFYMEINSGWYQTAFFFATGCELTYEADSAGNFTSSNVTYASEEGLTALKALINLASSSAFYNGSSVSNATNAAAIVDGTWDSGAAKELFGDNYACAKLPTFEADGPEYQMSGFGGFKLLGVKPQTDTNKAIVCMELAKYLSSAEVQLARYQEVGWGPSNLEAQADEAVQADEALTALAEQLTYTIPQGQYPNEYWDLATSLGDDIIAGTYDNSSDEELMSVLENFQTTCESYATGAGATE